jgi:hypothetical protein
VSIEAPAMTATIVIRMQPPAEVSPNFHGSFRQRAKAVREFRDEAAKATRYEGSRTEAFRENYRPVTLDAEIAWCCGRKAVDPTNAPSLLKAAIDGIADVLFDGRDAHILMGTVTQTRGSGTVTVVLRVQEGG